MAVALLLSISAACGSGDGGKDAASNEDPGCFLAFNSKFDGFRSWQSYEYDADAATLGGAAVHVAGPRTEYINQQPDPGSEFPVGTVIVKEVGAQDPANYHLFAMVKRGCNFNSSGARGWEFMEVKEQGSGATIIWRGVGPPAGEKYGGDANGCNSCHAACSDNDSICSTKLRLPAP
jgi:hypothetical protein